MARAVDLSPPERDEEVASFLREAAAALLAVPEGDWPEREGAWAATRSLGRLRWPWAPALAERIARPAVDERWLFTRLPEWEKRRRAPRRSP